MGNQLSERLKRIKLRQQLGQTEEYNRRVSPDSGDSAMELFPEWEQAGHKTLRRKIFRAEGFNSFRKNIKSFSPSLAILVPDIFHYGGNVQNRVVRKPPVSEQLPLKNAFLQAESRKNARTCRTLSPRQPTGLSNKSNNKNAQNLYGLIPENLVFFDLETTGLGGAGTIAFLAAFGRFSLSKRASKNGLEITQYLLLDFPGENDFIEAILKEFSRTGAGGAPELIVSYNGKAFDSQIIKTRCLMKGFSPPEYCHADLLHPCRRIWKRALPDCSQGTIETEILGLDRSGDIPGALAPDIWFSFLRTGGTADLLGICDHNIRDISGLARIFLALGEIAASPLESCKKFLADAEALALCWRENLRLRPGFFSEEDSQTAAALMDAAAGENRPKILRLLAIEAEWKKDEFSKALELTERILSAGDLPFRLKEETLRRRKRLLARIADGK